ncbi:MAG: 4-hydroxythreonine-4-phosphate dehydrogenase PdxA [Planctomycetota bacterium]|nr:MAG: 4-hydroxythreonine-4-phosphate dehydrogenase PdxA [Planctomycetota bacterium]
MGDPAGIGPEIIVKAWRHHELFTLCRPIVVGSPAVLEQAAARFHGQLRIAPLSSPEQIHDISPSASILPCFSQGQDEASDVAPGTIDARSGESAYRSIFAALDLVLSDRVSAIVTCPIHKEALQRAGHHYPGHTELLAERCGVDRFSMVLYMGPGVPLGGKHGLAVAHVTLHTAMRSIFSQITPEAVAAKAKLVHDLIRRLGCPKPRIGVCALNPHGGEGGLFGQEEQTIIAPGVAIARREGLDLEGPLPADTIMVRAQNGEFDAVVAMYHDQGHIALKLLGMHRAVNITAGLPIVRTSVAHGTAFDIAWQGKADPSSLLEAVRTAALLATRPR